MKKQTAVDQLRDRLMKEFGFGYSDNIHDELKAMEKEQIEEAYYDGGDDMCPNGIAGGKKAERYYNETYGQ